MDNKASNSEFKTTAVDEIDMHTIKLDYERDIIRIIERTYENMQL